jgi:hypothetical protein
VKYRPEDLLAFEERGDAISPCLVEDDDYEDVVGRAPVEFMTLERAHDVYTDMHKAATLSGDYLGDIHPGHTVFLRGAFTAEQLEALVVIMRNSRLEITKSAPEAAL